MRRRPRGGRSRHSCGRIRADGRRGERSAWPPQRHDWERAPAASDVYVFHSTRTPFDCLASQAERHRRPNGHVRDGRKPVPEAVPEACHPPWSRMVIATAPANRPESRIGNLCRARMAAGHMRAPTAGIHGAGRVDHGNEPACRTQRGDGPHAAEAMRDGTICGAMCRAKCDGTVCNGPFAMGPEMTEAPGGINPALSNPG